MQVNTDKPADNQSLIFRGSEEVIVEDDLKKKLQSGQQLRVKYGIDPTGSRIHIGHASVIRKLKHFQDLGHQIVLIVGEFTARIGDPSDKDSERDVLTQEEIRSNMVDYDQLLNRTLDTSQAEVRYNAEWFSNMGLGEFLEIEGLFSVAQMIERENFAKRFEQNKRIGLQEFMYPLLQGYDSVAVEADVELGGTDQLFNLTAGRKLQKHYDQEPQNLITYELLLGPDGRKMSKSWGNCIWVDDSPKDMYGKTMGVEDDLMYQYFRLVTEVGQNELKEIKAQLDKGKALRQLKARLAREVVKVYYDQAAAEKAEAAFERQFSEGKLPKNIQEVELEKSEWELAELLVELSLTDSKSQARRLQNQGGVRINRDQVEDEEVSLSDGDVVQVGKRRFRKVRIVDSSE